MMPRFSRFWSILLLAGTALSAQAQAPVPSPGAGNGPMPLPGSTTSPSNGPISVAPVNSNPGVSLPGPVAAAATPTDPANEEKVRVNLPDVPLDLALQALEIYTGKTILRPQQLPTPTISLVFKNPIPKSEAVMALETVLAMNQIGVIPLGDRYLKVVASQNSRMEAPEILEGSTLMMPPSGQVVAKLFQPQFIRASEFLQQVAPLLNSNVSGTVLFEKSNAVLITESVSNLQRCELLLKKLDHSTTPRFYSLRFAKASDLVNKLHSVFAGPLQAPSATFSADDRTNQVILLADPGQYPLFDDLVGKLDVKADPNTRNEVLYLKHASSKDVATLLSQLVSGQTKSTAQSGSVQPGQIIMPNQPIPQTGAPNPPGNIVTELANPTNQFSSLVTILPDERSNAVVVSGTVDDIRLIKDLVAKIDVVLAQVRIEVVIAEVGLTDNDVSGIAALGLQYGPNGHITSFNGSGSLWSVGGLPSSTATAATSLGGVVSPLQFVTQLSTNSNGKKNLLKVLSAPTVVTTHNKEADVVVGQQIPFISSSQATTNSGSNNLISPYTTTTSYKDITLELKVTPLIGDDGNIQLKIDQKADDPGDRDNTTGDIAVNHREVTSFVTVKDGNMIVLGGLQTSSITTTHNKLGLIWEIPVISQIFGQRSRSFSRTELLLFIRPVIIPPENGTTDTINEINRLSNRDQIKEYLNPAPPAADKKKWPPSLLQHRKE